MITAQQFINQLAKSVELLKNTLMPEALISEWEEKQLTDFYFNKADEVKNQLQNMEADCERQAVREIVDSNPNWHSMEYEEIKVQVFARKELLIAERLEAITNALREEDSDD